ncbi:PEP-CTERM sorting domain-containing protein [Phormidium sp. LEGE 05292]|uniref:PEP-CTERM sorting domain-containing protein n=1 Tax=[Phormidium] sp. LEGE 05292 TaxID=767427 RepID=UPI00187DE27F|nr:PEP-CTERM sorting domain-containing protein [Phormidium sp. LEGE 05292]MBE9227117.1 PEP-CTERM sorting domain-containing protein [Phormidium sp. LEGE 05292]
MNFIRYGLLAGTTVVMLLFTSKQSNAASMILQNANLAIPPAGSTVIGECATGGLCKPGDVLNLTYNPGTSSVFATNDTAYNFTKFIYTILPGQDAVWSSLSTFDFFKKAEVSSDGKVLTLSDGSFSAGATALFSATFFGNIPVNAAVTFEGSKAVPEPNTIVGLALVGAAGAYFGRRKQQSVN